MDAQTTNEPSAEAAEIEIDETLVERALSQSAEERLDLLCRRARELMELRDGRQS